MRIPEDLPFVERMFKRLWLWAHRHPDVIKYYREYAGWETFRRAHPELIDDLNGADAAYKAGDRRAVIAYIGVIAVIVGLPAGAMILILELFF